MRRDIGPLRLKIRKLHALLHRHGGKGFKSLCDRLPRNEEAVNVFSLLPGLLFHKGCAGCKSTAYAHPALCVQRKEARFLGLYDAFRQFYHNARVRNATNRMDTVQPHRAHL